MTIINDKDLDNFLIFFKTNKIKKKTIILEAGKVANEVYFLKKGCLRLFYDKNGNDVSAFFFTENMFAGAYDSFISRKQSRHSIEAIEDSEVYVLQFEEFHRVLNDNPILNEYIRKILEQRFVELHELFTSLILDTPEERYINLLKERPDLLKRVPQYQISTFLGITPVSLSRIRNRISRKR